MVKKISWGVGVLAPAALLGYLCGIIEMSSGPSVTTAYASTSCRSERPAMLNVTSSAATTLLEAGSEARTALNGNLGTTDVEGSASSNPEGMVNPSG
jgi:hypothetical protein